MSGDKKGAAPESSPGGSGGLPGRAGDQVGDRARDSEPPVGCIRRARATREEVSARVEQIAELMRACKWKWSEHRAKFCKEWGVSGSEVSRLANQASKIVLAEVTNRDTIKVTVAGTLIRVMSEGEDRDAVAAASTAAKLFALNEPETLDPSALVQSMPPSERVEWLHRQADGIRRALSTLLSPADYLAALEADIAARQEEIHALRYSLATPAQTGDGS